MIESKLKNSEKYRKALSNEVVISCLSVNSLFVERPSKVVNVNRLKI